MPGDASAQPLEALSADARWQALLHMNRGATLRNRGRSYVDDEQFFLAETGRRDPHQELLQSIAVLSRDGEMARCRFPARYRFLAAALAWQQDDPFSHCDEYQQWRASIPDASLVLVFPAAYLNSPSSMFGHTLLRFDAAQQESDWHAWAVNFGALVTPEDNSVFYIYRGLAGGYPGRFSTVSYVSKIQEYAHLENRDMWEYRLNLDADEIAWVIDHLWELKDINFDYYFLDENCSFRLLELIEVARPEADLLNDLRFAEVPVNTVRAIDAAGLIAERVYRPSKAMELEQVRLELTRDERRLATRLMRTPSLSDEEAYQSLAPERRHLVARAAWQTVRFRDRTRESDEGRARNTFALLRLIHANPAPALPAVTAPAPPEQGHATQMIALSGGQRQDQGFAELQYRLTYHDWLDNNHGFLAGAWIEALNVRVRREESDRWRLWQLDLVNIRSLAPRTAFVRPVSWFVHAGIDRPEVAGERGASRFVRGGPGMAWQAGGWIPYGYLQARIENNDQQKPFINSGAGAELGLLRHGDHYSLHVAAESLYFADDQYRHRALAGIQLPLTRQQGVRLSAWHDDWREGQETTWMMTWRYYFD
ncbi:MAG: DUF4105 domain-containing protein [Alcanivoracaceae bacterium]